MRARAVVIVVIIAALASGAWRSATDIGGEVARIGADFIVEYLRFVIKAAIGHLPEIVFVFALLKLARVIVGHQRDRMDRDAEKWARRE